MALQCLHDLSCGHIEDIDDSIDGSTRNVLSIGTLQGGGVEFNSSSRLGADVLTYAMLSVNFPFCGSRTRSSFPLSTLYSVILPSCDPLTTYLSQGENVTVHKSTGPRATCLSSCPVVVVQKHNEESRELLAIAAIAGYYLRYKGHVCRYSLWPSELMATDTIPKEWPVRVCRRLNSLSSKFHTLTTSSRPPVTMMSCGSPRGNSSSCGSDASGFSSAAVVVVVVFLPGFSCPQSQLQMLTSWALSSL